MTMTIGGSSTRTSMKIREIMKKTRRLKRRLNHTPPNRIMSRNIMKQTIKDKVKRKNLTKTIKIIMNDRRITEHHRLWIYTCPN